MNGFNRNHDGFAKWTAAFLAVLLLLGGAFSAAVPAAAAAGGSAHAAELYKTLSSGKRIPLDPPAPSSPADSSDGGLTVYLTFDDGPSKLTPEVLDILRQEEVKATFFEVGELARLRPEIVKRVVAEGHALGNHSYNHVYKELYGSYGGFWNQIGRTEDILRQITGIRTSLLRPPGGSYTNFDSFYFYLLEQAGYRVFDWNVDSSDATGRGVPAESIEKAVKKAPLKNRMVVLMHDGAGHEETVKALPAIIRHFKENGYRFEKLDSEASPVQFRLGKVKWQRTMGSDQFAKLLDASLKHAALYEKNGVKLAQANTPDREKAAVVKGKGAAVDATGGGKGKDASDGDATSDKGEGAVGGGTTGSRGEDAAGGDATGGKGPGVSGSPIGNGGDAQGSRSAVGAASVASGGGGLNFPGSPFQQNSLSPTATQADPVPLENGKLTVRINGKSWTLQKDDYELTGGRFMVSLSALAAELGGRYIKEPGTGAAALYYGVSRLSFPGSSYSAALETPGHATVNCPLLLLKEDSGGEKRIALRTAVELLGGRIAGYQVSGTGGIVEAECLPRLLYSTELTEL